jgi:hypothetical protein
VSAAPAWAAGRGGAGICQHACLARLQQLQRLGLGGAAAEVQQLPAWLSTLQHLEWLDVSGTQVVTPQPVLGLPPLLRRVVLPHGSKADVVLSHAPTCTCVWMHGDGCADRMVGVVCKLPLVLQTAHTLLSSQ